MTFDDFIKYLQSQKMEIGDMRYLFGIIPAYPVFMCVALFLVIFICVYQLNRKKIPLRDFELGLVIVVPIAIIGASVFGKIFLPNYQQWKNVFKIVFFWEPGMSFFGCLLFGTVAGYSWFYKRSRITKISVWVYFDIIVVNILIGQAIGRWGNLYNQEIMGFDVSYNQIAWMPNFIKHRLFYFPDLAYIQKSGDALHFDWVSRYANDSSYINGFYNIETKESLKDILNQKLQFKAPLFLIEGILNIVLWFLINFGVRNLHKVINIKNNPWNTEPKAFPCIWNKQYKFILEKDLIEWPTLAPIKYKSKNNENLKISLENVWRKAYFWKTPDYEQANELLVKNDKFQRQLFLDKQNLKKEKLKQKYNWQIRWLNVNPYAKEICQMNNPHNFKTIKSGVTTGCYIFGYGLIRIILETMRRPTEYMIPKYAIANFMVLSLILMTGILIIVIAQFIIPNKWREIGWLYEKSY